MEDTLTKITTLKEESLGLLELMGSKVAKIMERKFREDNEELNLDIV